MKQLTVSQLIAILERKDTEALVFIHNDASGIDISAVYACDVKELDFEIDNKSCVVIG